MKTSERTLGAVTYCEVPLKLKTPPLADVNDGEEIRVPFLELPLRSVQVFPEGV